MGGIEVLFHNNQRRLQLEPEGVELWPVQEGDWTEVSLSPLAVHSMEVAELQN